jgi:hypothetical protein
MVARPLPEPEPEEPIIPEWLTQRIAVQAGEKTWDDYTFEERTCKGWLTPFLYEIESMFWGRWDYWARTIEAGELLDEPIPKIQFMLDGHYTAEHKDKAGIGPGRSTKDAEKMLSNCLDHYRAYTVSARLSDFLEWLLWGFGDTDQEDRPYRVDEKLNEHWYRTFNLGPMIKFPKDYFGDIYAEERNPDSNRRSGFFPTPHNVVEMMVRMTMEGDKGHDGMDPRTMSVCEPCAGTGRMLMHASNYSVNLWGTDIDRTCVMACKVNGYLYIPWMVRPAPWLRSAGMKQGDSLAHPFVDDNPKVVPIVGKHGQLRLF